MQWRDRRHSFVDVLERVTDGVHVSIVERRPERNHQSEGDEACGQRHPRTDRDRRTRRRKV